MMTGYHVGAVLTALLGILVIERFGWHWMFVIGALPALVLVPLMWRFLPESTAFLRARAGLRTALVGLAPAAEVKPAPTRCDVVPSRAGTVDDRVLGHLLHGPAAGLRPQHLAAGDHEVRGLRAGRGAGAAVGAQRRAVLGLLVAGRVADAIGNRRSTIAWFAAAALFLALLSIKLPGIGIYVTVLMAGVFVFSAQVLVYAFVGHVYPASARGTAMGAASGVGRAGAISGPLIGGWLLTLGLAYPWGFYIFAAVAAIGAGCIALVNRNPAPDEPMPLTEDEADRIGARPHE